MKRFLIALLVLCGPDPVLAAFWVEALFLLAARPALRISRRSWG